MPPRFPAQRDPAGRLIRPVRRPVRPESGAGQRRPDVLRPVLALAVVILLALVAVAGINGYLAYRDSTGPRSACEATGGLWSTDLQACLRGPR